MSLPVSDYLAIEVVIGILLLFVLYFILTAKFEAEKRKTAKASSVELERVKAQLSESLKANETLESRNLALSGELDALTETVSSLKDGITKEIEESTGNLTTKVLNQIEDYLKRKYQGIEKPKRELERDLRKVREEYANEVSGLKDRLRDLTEKYESSLPETETPKARGTPKTPEARPKINPKSLSNLRQYRNDTSPQSK